MCVLRRRRVAFPARPSHTQDPQQKGAVHQGPYNPSAAGRGATTPPQPTTQPLTPPIFPYPHIFSAHPSGQEAPFPFPGPSSPASSPHTHLEQLGRGGHGARGWCWGGSSAALRRPTTASHCVPQPRHRHHRQQQPRHRLHPPETGLRRAATAARSSRLLPGPGRHLLPCPGRPPLPAAIPRPPPIAQRHGAAGALGAEARPPGWRRGAFLQVKPFLRGCAAGDGVGRGKGSWAAPGLCSHSGAEAAPSTPCSPLPPRRLAEPRRSAVIAGGYLVYF